MTRMLMLLVIVLAPGAVGLQDSEDEVTVDPSPHEPLVGLPCARTDIMEASVAGAGDVAFGRLRLDDLSAVCPGEDPNFQVYAYQLSFRPSGWDRGVIRFLLTSNGTLLNGELILQLAPEDGSLTSASTIVPEIDWAASTISFDIPTDLAPLPYTNSVFRAQMAACDGHTCGSPGPRPTYADRFPDVGTFNVEE